MNRTNRYVTFLVVVTAIVLGQATHSPAADDSKKKAATSHAYIHVKHLLKKRLEILQEIAKLQRTSYLRGEASLDSAIRSQVDALQAELELATKPDKRVAIRKKLLKQATELEAAAKKQFEAKEGTKADMLRAKAFRLRAEADLLIEKSAKHVHDHHHHDHKATPNRKK